MDDTTLRRVQRALPRGRTLFHYFDDRYALLLLALVAGEGVRIADLKRSRFRGLLDKPGVRALLATLGDGVVCAEDVATWWPLRPWTYRVAHGTWPLGGERWRRRWHQMTRRGHNLVVRLDFVQSHNRITRGLIGERVRDAMAACHPVARGKPEAPGGALTLAWARVDLDLDTGEALIEEVQSDWDSESRTPCDCGEADCSGTAWTRYRDTLYDTYCRSWADTMLAATLQQLVGSLGITRIFMHTPETGTQLKHMEADWTGPRSLYSALPRRFCFRPTHAPPLFLKRTRDRRLRRMLLEPTTRWHMLQL
ncbi:MAG: hypothetical protein P1V36_02770 [Planctomycetota bacterium]|nr:hypothetical protein [Planctomycetota bacterium]